MTVGKAVEEYLLACKANGLAVATVRWYESLLGAFCTQHGNDEITSITTKIMRKYIVGLRERNVRYDQDTAQRPTVEGHLSESTVAGHVVALKAFWNWVDEEIQLDTNPMHRIKSPRRRAPARSRAISSGDFVKLFNATLDNDAGIRDRAMLAFFSDTGCRLSGLMNLKIKHLQMNDRRAIVYEKGNRVGRMIVYTTYTVKLLERWLTVRQSESEYVFISMSSGEKLTDAGIREILKRLKKRAGVQGHVNPHAFRHAFARTYLTNGGNLASLAQLLGHKDVSTTANYYAVFSTDELADIHEKLSPLSGLSGLDLDKPKNS